MLNFRSTKNNDPPHTAYDYQDYLHEVPSLTGYWKLSGKTLTVVAHPSDFPDTVYTNVSVSGDKLTMTDDDGIVETFKKIGTSAAQ